MSGGLASDRDRSFALAQRAQVLMRDYGPSATPRAYAVWYTYVTGEQPLLNDAVKRLTTHKASLSTADVEDLYDAYLEGSRVAAAADDAGATILTEIEGIMAMLDLSLGSTAQYGESLRVLSQDLSVATLNRTRLREIVATLVASTREVAANNRTLEAGMRESRTEVEALREKLEATRVESLTDPLTGLANRKHFDDMLSKTVEASVRGGSSSLIVLDVDLFKRFNDLYGHLTGDQVLRLVAVVMRENVGKNAMLARFGGEEFGIVLPKTEREAAKAIAEKIRISVMGRELVKRSTGESLGKITISLGVAVYRRGDTAVSLLERADLCMLAAKRAGRNRMLDDTIASDPTARVA